MPKAIGQIRALIEGAPDRAMRELGAALGGAMGEPALDEVRLLIQKEIQDRAARDAALGPLRPMFGPREDGLSQPYFPTRVLRLLWRGAKQADPTLIARVAAFSSQAYDDVFDTPFDQACRLLATQLREPREEAFAAAAQILGDRCEALVVCLELVGQARAALSQLHDWLQHMTEERAVCARLAFKDANDACEGGGLNLFEILYANMQEPWQLLRLIDVVMMRPSDAFLAGTELGVFGERLLDDIDCQLEAIRTFDPDTRPGAGIDLARRMQMVSNIAEEFEAALSMTKGGPWASRLSRQKASLARQAEALLKTVDRTLSQALPVVPIRIGGRTIRNGPKLDQPPDEILMRRAECMLQLVEHARGAAAKGGYNALRVRVRESAEQRLADYAEDLIDAIHDGEPQDAPNARLYLDRVADLTACILDEQAASIVRRRAAAA